MSKWTVITPKEATQNHSQISQATQNQNQSNKLSKWNCLCGNRMSVQTYKQINGPTK